MRVLSLSRVVVLVAVALVAGCNIGGSGDATDATAPGMDALADDVAVGVDVEDIDLAGCVASCEGRVCGDDGCGGSCGTCDEAAGLSCNPQGLCIGGCTASCEGRVCGDDGCGGSCGDCTGADEVCASGACVPGHSCTDGQKNGVETDRDCGGGACPACATGRLCGKPEDCISGLCADGACAASPTCTDGAKGGDETDRDCGGSKCDPCAIGQTCKQHSDCVTASCPWGLCAAPTCDDKVLNQGESAVDCGGPCPPCKDGLACAKPADCASGQCEGLACISCADGVRNGAETDVDCGGPTCGKCKDGKKCAKAADCANGGCEGGTCCKANACGVCAALPAEVCNGFDDDCDGFTDKYFDTDPADCAKQTGVCKYALQECRAGKWVCDDKTLAAVSPHYQPTETSCDSRDNDCDGQTDEGLLNACGGCGAVASEVCNGKDDDCDGQTDEDLLNACGACGPVPAELCNGRDDDCDGQTDEEAACANCLATPPFVTLTNLYDISPAQYIYVDYPTAMVAAGTAAWYAYRVDKTLAARKVADNANQLTITAPGVLTIDGSGVGIPSVAPWQHEDGVLLAYTRATTKASAWATRVYAEPMEPPVPLFSQQYGSFGYTASASHGKRNLIAAAVSTGSYQNEWRIYESTDPMSVDLVLNHTKTKGWWEDAQPQLRFRSDGHPFAFVKTFKYGYKWLYMYSMADLDGTDGDALPEAADATYQPRSDALFAAILVAEDGTIKYHIMDATNAFDAGVAIGKTNLTSQGPKAAMALGPDDAPVIVGTSDGHLLEEYRQTASGAFVKRILATVANDEWILGTSVAVDVAGRAHIVAHIMINKEGWSRYRTAYVMSCWDGK